MATKNLGIISAYGEWLAQGNVGTKADFIKSLKATFVMSDLVSSDAGNSLTFGSDGKLFVSTGGTPPATFQITSFTNNKGVNELGVPVTAVTFNWTLANGSPITQSIAPLVGTVANALRTFNLTGQSITTDTTFTLSATDGVNPRTSQTHIKFYAPIFYGTVPVGTPTASQVSAMTKRIAVAGNFIATFNISSAHSCVASPMSTPIMDILDDTFGLSVLSNYNIINNVSVTLADGSTMLYRVIVSKGLQDTAGSSMNLRIVF